MGESRRGKKVNRTAPVSDETRQKLSAAAKGKRPTNLDRIHQQLIGKPKPAPTREKISKALAGKKQSPDVVAKRTASIKAVFATPESKQKRSEWCKRAWITRKRKLNGLES